MIGIYCIENKINNKKYIGKSKNIKQRWYIHRYLLRKEKCSKDCNRYLFNEVKKYGFDNFKFYVLEIFENMNEIEIGTRELFWMDFFKTCEPEHGFNLRRDTSSGMETSKETLKLQSIAHSGENNANYGNKWSQEQKIKMSENAKFRHKNKIGYNEEWKEKIGKRAIENWKDEERKNKMALAVSKAKEKYDFYQYTKEGIFIKKWNNIHEIIFENQEYKWQNIYSVCNGYKPTYMGFIWKKKLKNSIS